ncbi:MAG: alpha/beta hydrolase, partial [Desulfuromonadaceae bacterium]
QLGAFLIQRCNAFARGAALVGCKRHPMDAALRRAYCSPYDSPKNRLATLRFVQDIPLQPGDTSYALVSEVEQGLERFADRPMAIFWGEKDFVFDHHFRREWQRRFPAAELHSYPDAGHYVLEDAGDLIIPLIRQFLQQHPLGSEAA